MLRPGEAEDLTLLHNALVIPVGERKVVAHMNRCEHQILASSGTSAHDLVCALLCHSTPNCR